MIVGHDKIKLSYMECHLMVQIDIDNSPEQLSLA